MDTDVASTRSVARPRFADLNDDGKSAHRKPEADFLSATFDWSGLGLVPRWLGQDSSTAVAAIEPSVFFNSGGPELQRFLAGCGQRGETALAVSMIGEIVRSAALSEAFNLFDTADAVNAIGNEDTSISAGRRIALDSSPAIADGVTGADRELAMRLCTGRPDGFSWWPLTLSGSTSYRMGEMPGTTPEARPVGELAPLLVTGAGEVVAAVWVSPTEDMRHYIIPWVASWRPVLDWLSRYAVPEFNPAAARRTRRGAAAVPDLQTLRERRAAESLAQAEASWHEQQHALANELDAATAEADDVRGPLLYGSGPELVAAVASVLRACDLCYQNLDELLDAPDSADLIVSDGTSQILVEVKGVNGRPGERLVDDLRRHLRTWPGLRPDQGVVGGALVLNYQRSIEVLARDEQPYSRAAFVDSLEHPVIGSRQLFDAWRDGEYAAIRAWLFDPAARPGGLSSARSSAHRTAHPPSTGVPGIPGRTTPVRRWRPWRR